MKIIQVNTEILNELLNLSIAILNQDYSKRIVIEYNDEIVNEIASNLNLLADKLMLAPPNAKSDERVNISHFI